MPPLPVKWKGPCPNCGGLWAIEKKREIAASKLANAAQADDPAMKIKYVETGVRGFDRILSGGIVESQAILLAGSSGSRKTSLMLVVLNALAERKKRPVLFATAEQNEKDAKMFCNTMQVFSEHVKIMGNVSDLDEVFDTCKELEPVMVVIDSLQAVSRNSQQSEETLAFEIVQYFKRTSMCVVMTNHMTTGFGIKGGTGAPHYVDTVLAFEPFIPALDGDPSKLFGERALHDANVIWNRKDPEEKIHNLRVLTSVLKNRYGSIGDKVFFHTQKDGSLVQLEEKPKVLMFGRD